MAHSERRSETNFVWEDFLPINFVLRVELNTSCVVSHGCLWTRIYRKMHWRPIQTKRNNAIASNRGKKTNKNNDMSLWRRHDANYVLTKQGDCNSARTAPPGLQRVPCRYGWIITLSLCLVLLHCRVMSCLHSLSDDGMTEVCIGNCGGKIVKRLLLRASIDLWKLQHFGCHTFTYLFGWMHSVALQ